MSTLNQLLKAIKELPYADMMLVAQALHDQLDVEADIIANALAKLDIGKVDYQNMAAREEEILKEIFRRKAAMLISRHGGGWQLDARAIPGGHVVTTELRQAFPMMLDQIVTLHGLKQ